MIQRLRRRKQALAAAGGAAPAAHRLDVMTTNAASGGHQLTTPDRQFLEQTILPHLGAGSGRVLFVGCAQYTAWYGSFFPHAEYWTLDIDPGNAAYGAPRHIVGSVVDLGAHFEPETVDVIILNGVLGWGINTQQDAERTCLASHAALRRGGLLVIGWNRCPLDRISAQDRDWIDRTPKARDMLRALIDTCPDQLDALKQFARHELGPIAASRHEIRFETDSLFVMFSHEYHHVFDFFEKP